MTHHVDRLKNGLCLVTLLPVMARKKVCIVLMMKRATLLAFLAASFGFVPVAHAESAKSLLNTLPSSLQKNSQTIFSANTVGQLSLNSQYKKTTLESLLSMIRADLTKAGYCEEPIRTNVTRGTFSATWAPPKGTTVDGTPKGKYAVLATQAVMLDPSTINLNTSFRDVLAGDQAVTTSCYQDASKKTGNPSKESNTPAKTAPSKPSINIKLF